jgi:transcriptional regulator GlxA family with amidase domain
MPGVSTSRGRAPSAAWRSLIDQDEAKAQAAAKKHVGILIFNGVQIIDYTGPYEIFQAAGFDVYTVAETKEPITTVAGMTVVPKYSFAEAPQPDILWFQAVASRALWEASRR